MADNLLNRLNGPHGIWTQYCMTILTRNSWINCMDQFNV